MNHQSNEYVEFHSNVFKVGESRLVSSVADTVLANQDAIIHYHPDDSSKKTTTQYINGTKHGYEQFFNLNESPEAKCLKYYQNDSLLWTMFPSADITTFSSGELAKGIVCYSDSIYVKAPYSTGTIWYEGLFINGKERGTHLRYYKSGEVHLLSNYDIVDSSGNRYYLYSKNGLLLESF